MENTMDDKAKVSEEIIFELRGCFINLGANHDIKKMLSLQTDCENYLSSNIDNNHRHIENTIYALKALIDYNLNDNRQSAYEKAFPMLENLAFGERIELLTESNYNKFLLIYGILICKDYIQAQIFVSALERSVEEYPVSEDIKYKTLMSSYLNFIEVLIHSKLCGQTNDKEIIEIRGLFYIALEKAKKVILKQDRIDFLAFLTIKEVQFYISEFLPRNGEYLSNMRKNFIREEIEFWKNIKLYPEMLDKIKDTYSIKS